MTHAGFIGLGMMGAPMAHRLHAQGVSLTIRDADPQREESFIASHAGAKRALDAKDFSDCQFVFTMLPNSDIVEETLSALLPYLSGGTTVVDMSSADPNRTRALATTLAGRHVALLDAPVSGGVKKAAAGTLAIMVGGEPDDLTRARFLLEMMGQAITHVGPVGAGHALKALNNYVSVAALIATSEAIHAGAAFGIHPEVVVDVINASTGKNNTTENKAHQYMLSGAFDSGFSLALQAKDVGIAVGLARALGQPMSLGEQASQITQAASRALGPAADHTEIHRYLATLRAHTP